MGLYKPCYSVAGCSAELLVFELYEEAQARTTAVAPGNPGFDDFLGEPFLEDNDDDAVGERVRPGTQVTLAGKVEFTTHEEQRQDGAGNDPANLLRATVSEAELDAKGLLASGKVLLRPNDRLLRILRDDGTTRVDFEVDGRSGVFVFHVRPGATGRGVVEIFCEDRTKAPL